MGKPWGEFVAEAQKKFVCWFEDRKQWADVTERKVTVDARSEYDAANAMAADSRRMGRDAFETGTRKDLRTVVSVVNCYGVKQRFEIHLTGSGNPDHGRRVIATVLPAGKKFRV